MGERGPRHAPWAAGIAGAALAAGALGVPVAANSGDAPQRPAPAAPAPASTIAPASTTASAAPTADLELLEFLGSDDVEFELARFMASRVPATPAPPARSERR